MNVFKRYIKQLRNDERGQGYIEYGLILLLVGVGSLMAITMLTGVAQNTFRQFVGSGEFAPPNIGPMGGEFTPVAPTSTPPSQILTFDTNPTSPIVLNGAVTETVEFQVATIGNFALYEVDADGDGSYDLSWTPTDTDSALRQYGLSEGTYTAQLRATDIGGNILTAGLNLVVYENGGAIPDQAPVVSASADVASGSAPLTVNFNSVVSFDHDSTSAGAQYVWYYDEYGGGSTTINGEAGESFSHTYTSSGTYQVFLQVIDTANAPGLQVGESARMTVVVEEATPTPSPTSTNTPTPCPYGNVNVPGTIQFEDFNCDGSLDGSAGNQGNSSYRSAESVDLSSGGSGIYVSNTQSGEWLEYTVTTSGTQIYRFTVRYASDYDPPSEGADQTLQLFSNGSDVTGGGVVVPYTGSDTSFNDLVFDAPLGAGTQTLRFQINGDFSLDYFSVSVAPVPTPTVAPAGCTGLAYQAEQGTLFGDFEIGTDGSTQYIHAPNGSGSHYSSPNTAHRAEYCMVVTTPGIYRIRGNVYGASGNDDSFHIGLSGVNYLWDSNQNTSYNSDYVSHRGGADPVEVNLSAGTYTLSVYVREDGTRLDFIEMELVSAWTPTPTPAPPTPTPSPTPIPVASFSTVFEDNFNRSNSNSIGNSWTEKRINNKAEARIVDNRLCFTDTSDEKNRPLVRRKFSSQSNGQVRATFDFDWTRTGSEGSYEVIMTLGRNLPTGKNSSQSQRATAILVWSDENGHETLNYRYEGNDYGIMTLSGAHTIQIVADMSAHQFDVYVDGALVAADLAFENNENIDSIRFTVNRLNEENFSGRCFDNVLIEHSDN